MNPVIVLTMHGAPPNDFPRDEVTELFALHGRLQAASGPQRAALEHRYGELDAKVRAWPRTPQNDPFHAASLQLAQHLGRAAGCKVIVGFNEFCAPSLDEALDQAVAEGTGRVIVVTPMMTRGGEHSEIEIPAAIGRAQERHPGATFQYAWPFEVAEIAGFLAGQIEKLTEE